MFGWLGRVLRRWSSRPERAGPSSRPQDEGPLGPMSEQAARAFLERAGFRVIEANYRCPLGEVDLVARGESKLVFIEVKARRLNEQPAGSPRPEQAVNRRKQKRIGRVARHYCRARRCRDAQVRFDVIGIDWPDSGEPVIRHHKGAFRPDV